MKVENLDKFNELAVYQMRLVYGETFSGPFPQAGTYLDVSVYVTNLWHTDRLKCERCFAIIGKMLCRLSNREGKMFPGRMDRERKFITQCECGRGIVAFYYDVSVEFVLTNTKRVEMPRYPEKKDG